jgi:hypothetical protein
MSDAHSVAHPAVRALWFNFQQGGWSCHAVCVRCTLSQALRYVFALLYMFSDRRLIVYAILISHHLRCVCTYVISVPFSRYATKAATTFQLIFMHDACMDARMVLRLCCFFNLRGGAGQMALNLDRHDFIHILHRKNGFR